MLGLIIPTSDSGDAGGDHGGFVIPSETLSLGQRSTRLGRLLDDEDEGFNLDPGFTFDAEGNLIEERTTAPGIAPTEGVRLGSESAASGRMHQEMSEDFQARHFEVRSSPN